MPLTIWMANATHYEDYEGCWSIPCATKQTASELVFESIKEYISEIGREDFMEEFLHLVDNGDIQGTISLWNNLDYQPFYSVEESDILQLSTGMRLPEIKVDINSINITEVASIYRNSQSLVLTIQCETDVDIDRIIYKNGKHSIHLLPRTFSSYPTIISIATGHGWQAFGMTDSHLATINFIRAKKEHVSLWSTSPRP